MCLLFGTSTGTLTHKRRAHFFCYVLMFRTNVRVYFNAPSIKRHNKALHEICAVLFVRFLQRSDLCNRKYSTAYVSRACLRAGHALDLHGTIASLLSCVH